MFATFMAANLFAPPFVALMGSKWSIVVGSILYTIFYGAMLLFNIYVFYANSVITGVGAASKRNVD
jgi:hypothetical protein